MKLERLKKCETDFLELNEKKFSVTVFHMRILHTSITLNCSSTSTPASIPLRVH